MTDADLILCNGRIRTLDDGRPRASALAVKGGVILAVGSDSDALAHRGSGTEIVDLAGAAAVPGLIDCHFHPFGGALRTRGVDLMGAKTLDEVRRRLAAAPRTADGWVLGSGLGHDAFLDSGIGGTLIADAVGGAPALLWFADQHTALATPRALELAGIEGARTFTENAEVVCDQAGRPTGELRERPAAMLVDAVVPEMTDAERYALFARALKAYAAAGLTRIHAMDGTLETLAILRELEARGELPIRIVSPFTVRAEATREQWREFAEARDERGRRWRGGAVKLYLDGVIESGTGWLFEPDSEGRGREPFWPDAESYREAVRYFAERGFQCATHACGDRAVHEALNTYRQVGAPPGTRHRIEHIETIQPADLPRFAAEGVIASIQVQQMMDLAPDRTGSWSGRLGPERCDRAFPTRSLVESGALLVLGSDFPVAGYDPREGLAATRLRRRPRTSAAPYDEEHLSALDALRGYTTWAAAAVRETSALRAGAWADVTVFEEDPVDCPADDLVDDTVLLTVVEGEIVHRAG